MLDSYQEKIDSSALIIKWTRDVIFQRTLVCVYIYIYTRDIDIRNYACEIPSFSISLSLSDV